MKFSVIRSGAKESRKGGFMKFLVAEIKNKSLVEVIKSKEKSGVLGKACRLSAKIHWTGKIHCGTFDQARFTEARLIIIKRISNKWVDKSWVLQNFEESVICVHGACIIVVAFCLNVHHILVISYYSFFLLLPPLKKVERDKNFEFYILFHQFLMS